MAWNGHSLPWGASGTGQWSCSPDTEFSLPRTSTRASSSRSRIWERNRSTLTDGGYGLRWNQVDVDKVSFAYIEHDCAVDLNAQGPLSDHFRLFFHQDGTIGHRVNGRSFVSHLGNVVVHAPGADLQLDIEPFKLLLVSMDGEAVRAAIAQRFRYLPSLPTWLGALPESPAVQAMRSMASWMAAELERPGSPLASLGKSRLHAERLLLSLFIESLSDAAPNATEPVEEISRTQVRRAEEWIDAHLTDVIGTEEVAAAIGVGVRSLQRSFKRVHGCSPHEFICQRRLEATRGMLMAAGPGTNVTAIATALGFFELGRFSQRYRQHFGETPSATLARRSSG